MTGGKGTGRLVKRVAVGFVTTGLLLLSFVAYQLWGTALYEHHAQDQLRNELATKFHTPRTTVPTTTPGTATDSSPINTALVAPTTADPKVGTPIGLLSIPAIGMHGAAIVEGTDENQLQQGPGHYLGTSLPGQAGNVAIAGHRTTYGAPFYDLNELQPGDPVYIQTAQGIFGYQVVGSEVVQPTNTTVLAETTSPTLTLTTCNPRYSAATRLVVKAVLKTAVTSQSFPAATTSTTAAGKVAPPTTVPVLAGGNEGGLGGVSTRGEVGQSLLWGALTVLAAVLGLVGWRRGARPWSWVVFAMGIPVTVGALLVCFQHISLALPQTF
ncbi:MAG TPA: class E sortase [Acidimicrobiales bacterium]|nr:class E sortase [Acidimicrobiales bacterium]